jgi:hypothetical protein
MLAPLSLTAVSSYCVTMSKVVLTLEQAVKLVGQLKAAAEGRAEFADLVMPNGQKLPDCTFGYLSEIGEAMKILGLADSRNFWTRLK